MQLASQSSTGAVGLSLVAGFSSAATYLCNIQKPIVFTALTRRLFAACFAEQHRCSGHVTALTRRLFAACCDRAALVQWTRTGSQSLVL